MSSEHQLRNYVSGFGGSRVSAQLPSEVVDALYEARDAFEALPLTTKAISGAHLSDEAHKRIRKAKITLDRALTIVGRRHA